MIRSRSSPRLDSFWRSLLITALSDRPGRWKRIGPQQLGELGLGHHPLALGDQVDERQAPLPAGKVRVAQQLIVALDGHLTGQIDTKQ